MIPEMTKEEREGLINQYPQTPSGKARFRAVMLQGWPDFRTALQTHYIPALIARAKRTGKT